MISLTTIALAVIGFAIFYYFSQKKERYPPGPNGIPLFGNLLQIGLKAHETFDKWKNTYGPIFSVNLGPNPVVVINDVKLIREAFNETNFSGRPSLKAFHLLPEGRYGVLNVEGDTWVDQRRFTLRNLRDFGFGKNQIEVIVTEEVQTLLSWMKKECNHPISLDRKFRLAAINSLWTIMTGERYDHDDPQLNELLDVGNKAFNEAVASGAIFFEQLAQLFPKLSGWQMMVDATNIIKGIFQGAVQRHEQNPADDDNPRDFIDVYRKEISKTTDPKSSFYKEEGRKALLATIGDLFVAGSETTSQTLRWTILYLICYPEVQKKLRKEIDEVIGHNRLPCLADRPSMRYFEALIMEIFRITSLVPLGVFHNTMTDVEFHGFKIPKNTMVMGNLYSAHYSKETWGDPENFRPERFLSTDGKAIVRSDSLMPFGIGKRACLGETLARDELFLFITSIYQKFEIMVDPAHPKPSMEAVPGFVLTAPAFTVLMKERIV